ncbi:MAG: small multi-drug export protein [bacterium]|nr:small multi-drug export protein [bacterium]
MNELLTILFGATPIGEVRAAIPVAIFAFGFAPLKAYFLAVFGNLLPIVPGLFFLHYISTYLMEKNYWANRFLSWVFKYTRDRYRQKFIEAEQQHHHHHWREFWRFMALMAFVAIPFPITGVWSGMVAAFVFGFSFWRSVAALSIGAAISGLIVLAISLGIVRL